MYYCRPVDDYEDVMGDTALIDGEQLSEYEEDNDSDSDLDEHI